MKRNILYILFPILFLSIIFISCSGASEISEEKIVNKKSELTSEEQKKKALEYFINGGVFETQGNYEAAAAQYEKALLYDSTAGLYYTLAK
ncbi:MAG TPA: hypothetical protein VF270_00760, partial [Ignavibacteriaceae bacterium]